MFCRRTLERILTGSSAAHKTLTFSTHTDNIACWVTCWSLSLYTVQGFLWSLSLWSAHSPYGHSHSEVFSVPYGNCHSEVLIILMVTITLKFLVFLMVTITLKCSVFLMFTVTLTCSFSLWSLSLWSVQCSLWSRSLWSAHSPYGHSHSAVLSAPYGHCHCSVHSPYVHCHSAPYRSSAVVMNDSSPRTASRQSDAAVSHSAISTQCCTQLPAVIFKCHQTTAVEVLLPQSKIIARFSQSQHYLHITSADLSTYI
jgi:hypothetical protein